MPQFISSIFVTDDDGMGMLLETADGPHVVNRLFDSVTKLGLAPEVEVGDDSFRVTLAVPWALLGMEAPAPGATPRALAPHGPAARHFCLRKEILP